MEPVQSGETMISRVQPGMLPPEVWMEKDWIQPGVLVIFGWVELMVQFKKRFPTTFVLRIVAPKNISTQNLVL